jgi:hypothetical protein
MFNGTMLRRVTEGRERWDEDTLETAPPAKKEGEIERVADRWLRTL